MSEFKSVAQSSFPSSPVDQKSENHIIKFLTTCIQWHVAYNHGVIYKYTDPFNSDKCIFFEHYCHAVTKDGQDIIRIYFGNKLDRTPIHFGSDQEPCAYMLPDLCVEVCVNYQDHDGSIGKLFWYKLYDPRTNERLYGWNPINHGSKAWKCWRYLRELSYRHFCVSSPFQIS